jgi:predicted RNase H-like HicB family nuclease
MRYAVIIEKSGTGIGAYVPDLPGCVAVGETVPETERMIREAIEFHIEGLREDGLGIPETLGGCAVRGGVTAEPGCCSERADCALDFISETLGGASPSSDVDRHDLLHCSSL